MLKIQLLILVLLVGITSGQTEITLLKQEVETEANNNSVVKTLKKIVKIENKTSGYNGALTYLAEVRETQKGKVAEAASICLSIPLLCQNDKIAEAVTRCKYVCSSFEGTYWAEECLFNLYEMYLNDYDDESTANAYLEELQKEFPDSKLLGGMLKRNFLSPNSLNNSTNTKIK